MQDTAAAQSAGPALASGWHTHLGQLSGGQRTLVSLAMLLAVARTGSACGLLLLDEVDAALDEVNQARASGLLKQLAGDRTSACQIMCVTHNYSFQEACDGFVRVTKSPSGHSMPAEQDGAEDRATMAAGAAAAGGKGSRKKGVKLLRGTGPAAKAVRGSSLPGGDSGAAPATANTRAGGNRAKKVRFDVQG